MPKYESEVIGFGIEMQNGVRSNNYVPDEENLIPVTHKKLTVQQLYDLQKTHVDYYKNNGYTKKNDWESM